MSEPIQLKSKIHHWCRKAQGRKVLPSGETVVQLQQWGAGKNKNNGPVGRRKRRWYAARFSGGGYAKTVRK